MLSFVQEKAQRLGAVRDDQVELLSGVFVQQQLSKLGVVFWKLGRYGVQILMNKVARTQIVAFYDAADARSDLLLRWDVVIVGIENQHPLMNSPGSLWRS